MHTDLKFSFRPNVAFLYIDPKLLIVLTGKRVRNIDNLFIKNRHLGRFFRCIFSMNVATVKVAEKPKCGNNQ
ncbi:hypothetical protein AAY55_13565 [Vibrio metoecus]|uniref:Uncharacterized protein n=1 Tax=Vibrio metoecus TaxID=1481663 RepID=A0A0Q0MRX9_VIBMT|nr:hypothetical protein AAY55_13565 [Vibrio metoecus]